jgi:hypothetical protein
VHAPAADVRLVGVTTVTCDATHRPITVRRSAARICLRLVLQPRPAAALALELRLGAPRGAGIARRAVLGAHEGVHILSLARREYASRPGLWRVQVRVDGETRGAATFRIR